MPKIAVILPALNEEEAVARLIGEIPTPELAGRGYDLEIIVVDNDSTDNTARAAREAGATVLFSPLRGKGRAIKTGFDYAEADFFFMLDADYTYPPSNLVEMVDILKQNDIVLGSRIKGQREKGSMKPLNYLGNILLSSLASGLYRRKISDLCTGYWGFKAEVARKIDLADIVGFELETRLFIQVVKHGYKYKEIPINYRRRIGTRPKLNLTRDGIKIAISLFRHLHDHPASGSKK